MTKYNHLSKEELLEIIKKQENELKKNKYGLVWDSEREPEQVVLDCENYLPVLEKVKEIKTDKTEDNILIEGDNYHALTCLNYTHKEKIDIIYIDPPYNTGSRDFIYNDNYVDKEDGYRHSKWLNFMEKRLILAKKLLSKDGVLFCSIDDKEYPRLVLLFEKIFGENKIKTICIKMSEPTGVKMTHVINNGGIAKLKEYLVIVKMNGIKELFVEKVPKDVWDNEYKMIFTNVTKDEIEYLKKIRDNEERDLKQIEECDEILKNLEFLNINEYFRNNKITTKKDKENFKYENAWRIFRTVATTKSAKEISDKKRLDNINIGNFYTIVTTKNKMYFILKDYNIEQAQPRIKILLADDYLTQHPGDIWSDIKTTGLNNEGEVEFLNGKKPLKLIERVIKMIKKQDITILDFFAGSGTTGEAVLKLKNDYPEINYKFILCNINEKDEKEKKGIFESKLLPRIEYAIEKYNGNIQYLRTKLIKKSKNKDQTKMDLTQECTYLLSLKENMFKLVKDKEDYKIFSSNKEDKYLGIYYNIYEDSFHEFIKEIKKLNGDKKVYVFSLEDKIERSIFKGVENLKIETIPQKILDIYKQLVKLNIPIKPEIIFIEFNKAKDRIFLQKDKDEGARSLRIVLEKLLQKIAQNNGISILNSKGSIEKIAIINDLLKKYKIINQVLWEENKTFLTIGNNAAHGEYEEYNIKQVENFYKHIQSLLNAYIVKGGANE